MVSIGTFVFFYFTAVAFILFLWLRCSKRVNDFYKVYYLSWGHPIINLLMDKSVKKKYPSREERLKHLRRSTFTLCSSLPPGTYKAETVERVIDGLKAMERHGRAKIIRCSPNRKPRRQTTLYRHVLGWFSNVKEFPKLQHYNVTFTIYPPKHSA